MKIAKKIISIMLAALMLVMQLPVAATEYDALTQTIIESAAEIIAINETGNNYGSVNANDNGAVSLGLFQWHGVRALSLLREIAESDTEKALELVGEALYSEIVDDASDWSARPVTEEEKPFVSALLSSEQGVIIQTALARQDASAYVSHGRGLGILDTNALVYYCDLENQNGQTGVKKYAAAAAELAGDYASITIDDIHTAAMGITSSANYKRREATYAAILALGLQGVTAADDVRLGILFPRPTEEITADSTEDDKLWVLSALVILGYDISADVDSFDEAAALISDFQQIQGLTVTGTCDTATVDAIVRILSTDSAYRYPTRAIVSTTSGNLYLRSSADTSSNANILDAMPKDSEIVVLAETTAADGTLWYKLIYDGTEGFGCADYITLTSPLLPEKPVAAVESAYSDTAVLVDWNDADFAEHYHLRLFSGDTLLESYDDLTESGISLQLSAGTYTAVVTSVAANSRFTEGEPLTFTVVDRQLSSPVLNCTVENEIVFANWTSSEGATVYNLYRSDDGIEYTLISSSFSLSYTDTAVEPATVYYYRVDAGNGITSAASGVFSVTTGGRLLESVSICTPPTKTVYFWDEIPSWNGLTLLTVYSDGMCAVVDSGFDIQYNVAQNGKKTVTVTYCGFSAEFDIVVGSDLPGDANDDGAVNILDATLIARSLVGTATLTEIQRIDADLNLDNTVNILDATLILRYCAYS